MILKPSFLRLSIVNKIIPKFTIYMTKNLFLRILTENRKVLAAGFGIYKTWKYFA